MRYLICLTMVLASCTFSVELQAPFGMAEKEVDKRIQKLVNPPLKEVSQALRVLAEAQKKGK